MQNKSRMYALALKETLESVSQKTQTERIKNFKKLLKKRGDLKLAAKILQEFYKAWRDHKGKVGELMSAKPLSFGMREYSKKALQKKGFIYEEKVDASLVGGVALLLGNEYLIDNTIQSKIQKLRKQLNIMQINE